MDDAKPAKRKVLFSSIAAACLLISLLLGRAASTRLDAGEALEGYGQLGIMISFLVALSLSGLVTSQIGLFRGEKPLAFPLLTLVLNAAVFFAVILHIPR